MTDTTLRLSTAFDRSLAWYQGGSVRYLVSTIEADHADQSQDDSPTLTNLALVIDASASMSGEKLAAAKNAACGLIAALGAGDLLSVVSFASDVQVHVAGLHMDESGRAKAVSAVRTLETRGNTNLSDGWLTGAAAVAERMTAAAGMSHRVILLSDGLANEGITSPTEFARHASELQARGITTSTVGIGDDYDATLLQILAEEGGGQLHDAELAEDIVYILLSEVRAAQATALERVVVQFEVPHDVDASLVGFYPSTFERGCLTVRVGALAQAQPRVLVVQLMLPKQEVGRIFAFRASARGTAVGTDAVISAPDTEAKLTFARGTDNNAQGREIGISVQVAQAWQAQIVHAVAGMNRSGERRQAQHFLERELRYFERYCRDLPGTESWVRELAQVLSRINIDWDERTRKVMQEQTFRSQRMQAAVPIMRPIAKWQDRFR